MEESDPVIFALETSHGFGERVCRVLETPLSRHEERSFEDGEHKTRPLIGVRDRDVYVIQSLHGDESFSPNDKLCRLLFFLGALREGSAGRITAVVPYLCYARKDRKTKPYDPVTTRYVAGLFEAVGVDCLVTMDVHNLAAFQNAFHLAIPENLQATPLFARYFAAEFPSEELVVVSPDAGGVQRAEQFRQALSRETRCVPATWALPADETRSVAATLGSSRARQGIALAATIFAGSIAALLRRFHRLRRLRGLISGQRPDERMKHGPSPFEDVLA